MAPRTRKRGDNAAAVSIDPAKIANAEPCCVLCAVNGASRPGAIPEGGGVPLCAEHRARMIEQSRRPPQPDSIGAFDGSAAYLQHCTRCALEGRTNELGLAAIARPADATLH